MSYLYQFTEGKKTFIGITYKGIDYREQLTEGDLQSLSQTEPVAPNDTRNNRALNRRANIRFL